MHFMTHVKLFPSFPLSLPPSLSLSLPLSAVVGAVGDGPGVEGLVGGIAGR